MLLAMVNSKGGVGKSTLAVHASVWLCERGLRVAVIDADAQGSTSQWLSQAAPDIRIEACHTAQEITDRWQRLRMLYDVVVADGPAALNAETGALVASADVVLLPIGPSMMDVQASYRTARLIYKVRLQRKRGGFPIAYTVLNRVLSRSRLAKTASEAVAKFGFPTATTTLHLRQPYADACGRGSVVWRMGLAASKAASEITSLFREVLAVQSNESGRGTLPIERLTYQDKPLEPLVEASLPTASGPTRHNAPKTADQTVPPAGVFTTPVSD